MLCCIASDEEFFVEKVSGLKDSGKKFNGFCCNRVNSNFMNNNNCNFVFGNLSKEDIFLTIYAYVYRK